MDTSTRTKLSALLRAAAARAVSEEHFWQEFKALVDPWRDPVAGIAHETATHYWGNFHSRNIFLIPVRPDVYQLMQGQDALNLIAEGLERDWSMTQLKRKLKDI